MWLYWGMIVKIMQRLHFANPDLFNFTFRNDGQPYDEAGYRALLFTLPAVAGLAGATLRIPNSFMIAICGGRNVKFMTTVLLIIPALATGYCSAESCDTVLTCTLCWQRCRELEAVRSPRACPTSRSSFPNECRGWRWASTPVWAMLGVSVMQFLIPWVITFGLFGSLGGDPQHSSSMGSRNTCGFRTRPWSGCRS